MSALTDALNYVLDRRTAIGFDIGGSILAPGLPRLKIIETIQAISDEIPEELIELYEWRNGNNLISYFNCFIPNFSFKSLEDAIRNNKYNEELAFMSSAWGADLVVILGKDAGIYPIYCRDMVGGEIYEQCFDSLTAMFQTIAVCFDEDLYLWDTDLETIQGQNYERYCQIHKQHNPNSSPLQDAYFCEDL